MRLLIFAGLLSGATSLAAIPASAQQRVMVAPPQMSGGGNQVSIVRSPVINRGSWGTRVNGRWYAGYQAPGGWGAYRRPVSGFVLPGFWLQPNHYIADYRSYDLPVPAAGYGWSRYYDDAVLTDQYGRVQDARVGYEWDRYADNTDDRAYREDGRRGDGRRTVAGAVLGGVTGGLIGSAIAGPGSRTGGAILGAGVGAITGGALAEATSGDGDRYDGRYNDRRDGYGYDPSHVRPGAYAGAYDRDDAWDRRDDERKIAREEAKLRKARAKEHARLDKLARKAGYRDYDAYLRVRDQRSHAYAPPRPAQPHWALRGGPEGQIDAPRIEYQALPGYVANGYYYPGPTLTTVTVAPSVVTTTTTSYVTTKVVKPIKPKTRTKLLKR